jgi:asparagine synthase (glutamine-hydrolysing)
MCGIAGVIRFDRRAVDAVKLQRMSDRVAHRGPDDAGTFVEGPVGLAHRRLSILDLTTAARQPMRHSPGPSVLCYNGEVYNYRDLRTQLESLGHRFSSSGDTEVLLAACTQWGAPEAARRANGMFAFAWWDPTRQELWLARDRMGIKPLYYHCDANRLIFASEIKALLGEIDAQPDERALTALLMRVPLFDPQTPFKGVRAVECGQTLRIRATGEVKRQYYFALAEAVDRDLYRTLDQMPDDQVVAAVDQRVRASVAIHAASDAPVGTMISGGVDSGLVSALAKSHVSNLSAYHADVQGPYSELKWAYATAQHLGLPLHVLGLTHETYLRTLAEATWFNEWPISLHPNTVPFFLTCRLAAQKGVKVLLTGEGADELFAGYGVFRSNARRRRLTSWIGRLSGSFAKIGLGRLGRFLIRTANSPEALGARSPAATLLTGGRSSLAVQAAREAYGFVPDPVEREFHADLFGYLGGYLQSILWRNDRMGMAVGLESRVPYLDNDLVRCAINLPMRFKLRRRADKWALRQAAQLHLPGALSDRPKMGFPVDARAYVVPPLDFFKGGFVEDCLDIGPQQLKTLTQLHPDSRFDLAMIEIWGRMFFGGVSMAEMGERILSAQNPTVARPKPQLTVLIHSPRDLRRAASRARAA